MWCSEQPQTLKKTEEGEREESSRAAAVSAGSFAQCCNLALIPGAAAPSPGVLDRESPNTEPAAPSLFLANSLHFPSAGGKV